MSHSNLGSQPGSSGEDDQARLAQVTEATVETAQLVIRNLLEMLSELWGRIEGLEHELDSYHQQEQSGRKKTAAVKLSPETPETNPEEEMQMSGVLIVDDSQILRMRLESIVRSLGFHVRGMAEDGIEGAKMAASLKPRLIILDQLMPGMNGLECLKSIRKAGITSRVIICSANITAKLSREFAAAGANLLLTKPIQLDTFAKAVLNQMQSDS